MLLRRDPDLVLVWAREGVRVRHPRSGVELIGPRVAATLALFDGPRSVESALKHVPEVERGKLRVTVRDLRSKKFLIPASRTPKSVARAEAWAGAAASAQYHAACRDLEYLQEPAEILERSSEILATPRPPVFNRRPSARRVELPKSDLVGEAASLDRILGARRTVRRFRKTPIGLPQLAQLLRLTFGLTGVIVTEFGPLGARTSPSAGALHPIESYVMAWNVRGLPAGLYHYDVLDDALRRIRRGDLRRTAVEIASGQKWISTSAFLCVLTAAFPRVLWKYPTERSYRNLYLDAGHLAQTFCLVATSLGLGPFTTAAIQDSKIEKLLGIDGVQEFPVYLCGAGVPAAR